MRLQDWFAFQKRPNLQEKGQTANKIARKAKHSSENGQKSHTLHLTKPNKQVAS